MQHELLKRHGDNPIITPEDMPFLCNAIYNPGAVRFGDKYLLMPRVEDGRRDNRLHVALSDDGVHFTVEPQPIALPLSEQHAPFEYHMYDPRITYLEGRYYIAYCAQDFDETVRIGLCSTLDFKSFERHPFITQPWSRNCALFPEKIRGLYARVDRPMSANSGITWVSYSPDLVHWGQSEPVKARIETWMRDKWGPGPTPIRTDHGWLLIFHGVWFACNYVYKLGVMLLDLENPARVIGQFPHFILSPLEPWERVGETHNCVFSNGAIPGPNGLLHVYYGAADTCIGLATAPLQDLIDACLENRM